MASTSSEGQGKKLVEVVDPQFEAYKERLAKELEQVIKTPNSKIRKILRAKACR